ncbi:MAG TPA: isoprenylcysteine carboxylmethyltransferase family protein [Candidatus Angelobacter sp.]|nr:isoprenylcysteine carboxylmethyltransferase family protein [Candidatus Angelobacter sp.]
MPSWSRIATRSRVPLGFLFAAAYLWFARPTGMFLIAGSVVIATGLAIRTVASGHIHKNAQLAVTGPYARTRNPLYLGSIVMALGFILAARSIWLGAAALAMFLFIYVPVIQAEESYLRSAFPEYLEYAAQVPRFWPRLTSYRAGTDDSHPGFSWELYMRHREYNAVVGSALILGALILKMVLV